MSSSLGDTLARFNEYRKSPDNYPLNLIRTEAYAHALESYAAKLKDDQYFSPTSPSLYLWDLNESRQAFKPPPKLKTAEDVANYLDSKEEDPWWRFMCVLKKLGRNCSREQLQFLLTYHQVMPSFLEFIFSFKVRERPLAQAFFRHENYLEKEDPFFSLPALGRSSTLLQHAFNLLSVEKGDNKNDKNQWPLRQAALYHAFDVQTGRTLWAVLKGNLTIQKMIRKAFKSHRDLQTTAMISPERSFVASLHVHLIVLEWCIENWGEYIDTLDDERSDKSIDAKVVPLSAMTSPDRLRQSFSRKGTNRSNFSNQSTLNRHGSISPGISSTKSSPTSRSFTRSWSDLMRRGSGLKSLQTENLPEEEAVTNEEEKDDNSLAHLDVRFSFDEFQRLSFLGDELEQAIIAIEQNKGVIIEIQAQYEMAVKSVAFKAAMRLEKLEGDISTFFRRVRSVDRELDMHLSRLKALAQTVENDKTMFDAVLQYKSAKTSEFFAQSAKESSDRMEDWTKKMHTIAVKTEQETVSMHVITIFTLVFLPGTFLAVRTAMSCLVDNSSFAAVLTSWQTFFSSGVLRWDEEGTLGSDWIVRPDGMKLFFAICAPLMVIILAGWSYMYWRLRRNRQMQRALMDGMGYADEKGPV